MLLNLIKKCERFCILAEDVSIPIEDKYLQENLSKLNDTIGNLIVLLKTGGDFPQGFGNLPQELISSADVVKRFVSANAGFTKETFPELYSSVGKLRNFNPSKLNSKAKNYYLAYVKTISNQVLNLISNYYKPKTTKSRWEDFKTIFELLKAGKQVDSDYLEFWDNNYYSFKSRLNYLNGTIQQYKNNPYQDKSEMAQWQNEKRMIEFVISKLG